MGLREILSQDKDWDRRNTLCIPRAKSAVLRQKIRRTGSELFRRHAHLKRERGEFRIHPAIAPVSLMSADTRFVVNTRSLRTSGGQNLAALCTTAGQNLTAVGSSHSLPETVDLGSVTAAGLIGTLHGIHLLNSNICSTVNLTAATHTF